VSGDYWNPSRVSLAPPIKCLLVCAVALFGGCSSTPKEVKSALARITKIPKGMEQGKVFDFLSLPKPSRQMDFSIRNPGLTWVRYEIGFGDQFVLECEAPSAFENARLFRFDTGILHSVSLRRYGRPIYETLNPAWSEI